MRRTVAGAVSEAAPVGIPLHVRDEGQGPPIVLVHGLGGDHTIWNAVVPRLAPGFRVLAPDLRGHGRSTAPAGATYRLDDLEADLARVLTDRGLPSAHFVGQSAGAMLVLRLGLDAPEQVRSVTLVGGAAYMDAHTRSVAEGWAEAYAEGGADAFAVRMLKDLYYPDWIEAHMEIADRVREEVPRHDYGPALAWGRAIAAFDERARIATLRPPALMIQAMDDAVVDASHGRILRQSIPGSKIRILAQTGHMVPVERPTETAEAVGSFVREVEAARRS